MEGYTIVVPEAVAREVVDEPKKFAEEVRARAPVLANKITGSAMSISNLIEQGLIRVEDVDYRKLSKVMDNVRKHLSKLEAKPEHAVKKGDAELIALVIQLYREVKERVFVATFDKGLLKALKPFDSEVKFEVLERL